jgi:hypothetical protein
MNCDASFFVPNQSMGNIDFGERHMQGKDQKKGRQGTSSSSTVKREREPKITGT